MPDGVLEPVSFSGYRDDQILVHCKIFLHYYEFNALNRASNPSKTHCFQRKILLVWFVHTFRDGKFCLRPGIERGESFNGKMRDGPLGMEMRGVVSEAEGADRTVTRHMRVAEPVPVSARFAVGAGSGQGPGKERTHVYPLRPNQVWRYDFAMVRNVDGCLVRILVIIDEFTQECLKMVVASSLGSRDLLEALWGLFVARGIPEYIRSDNGPECATKGVRQWLARIGVKTLFIEPENPWEGGYDQSFIGKTRDGLLNREVFEVFLEAKALLEPSRGKYSDLVQCRSLDHLPPAPEPVELQAVSTPTPEVALSPGAGRLRSPADDAPHLGSGSQGPLRAGAGETGTQVPPAPAQNPPAPESPSQDTSRRVEERRDAPPGGAEEGGGQTPWVNEEVPFAHTIAAAEERLNDVPRTKESPLDYFGLLHRGAEKGLSGFQLELGERYARGVGGVPKNYVEARKWLTRAFHDPEFPEHREQAAALLAELNSAIKADSGKRKSMFGSAATVHLGLLKPWHVAAAVAVVTIAVILWLNR